jgi:ABC-type transport system involved in multi-copper enzyme maturation permease subunit
VPVRPPRFWRLKRILRSFDPLKLFFGPVFHRDMRISGRRKGGYAARFIVLAVPTAIVTLVFIGASQTYSFGSYSGTAAARIQALQSTAWNVAITVAWCQLIMLALIAPLLTAGAIVEERTARALSVIAASPLSAGRVIGGLFAARMVQLSLLAFLPLPLILAIRTFGGLETSFILWSSAVAVCSAIATAAAGLWASTRATRPAAAVSFAVLLLLAHWGTGPLTVLLDLAIHSWSQQPTTYAVMVSSPPAALLMLQQPEIAAFTGVRAEQAAAINCAISLALAAVALLLARFQLARLIATDRVELVRQPTRRQRRKALRAASEAQPEHDPSAPPISPGPIGADHENDHSREVTGNPVMWRELRQPLFAAPWKRWAGVLGIVTIVAIIHASTLSSYGRDASYGVVMVPSICIVALLILTAASVPAGAVTTELEARTWATLLTTPLSTFQILLPKVLGALRRLWPPFLFITLHLVVCIARGIAPVGSLPFTLLHFGAYAVFLCCTGVFFSLCSRKSAVASTLNLSVAFALWLLGPIFFGLLVGAVLRGSDKSIGLFLFSNPVFTYGAGLANMCESPANYDMGPLDLAPLHFYILWAFSLMVYLAFAGVVLTYARQNFHRLSTARI